VLGQLSFSMVGCAAVYGWMGSFMVRWELLWSDELSYGRMNSYIQLTITNQTNLSHALANKLARETSKNSKFQ
jgi:hypothetical protein